MKAVRLAAALFALATLSISAPSNATNPPAPLQQDMTCHEECTIRCAQLYPGNTTMKNRCTWSCIDSQCGGGPYP